MNGDYKYHQYDLLYLGQDGVGGKGIYDDDRKLSSDEEYEYDRSVLAIGSKCEIYSNSDKKWYTGSITDSFIETNEKYFTVQYHTDFDYEVRTKRIHWDSPWLRPITNQ